MELRNHWIHSINNRISRCTYLEKDIFIKEKVVKNLNKKNKNIKKLLISNQKYLYSCMESGTEIVLKSPSSLNNKEILLEVNDEKVKTIINIKNYIYEGVNLGINMLNFELDLKKDENLENWYNKSGSYIFLLI